MDGSSELKIVLVGKTGSGKSSLGNIILGKTSFHTALSPKGVTKQAEFESSERFGKTIVVIDTPGLTDPSFRSSENIAEMSRCCKQVSPGAYVFLLIVTIGRLTIDDATTIQTMKDVFGENIMASTVVVFTRMDDLEREGVSFNKYIKEAPSYLQELLKECKHVSMNATSADDRQIKKLLEMVDHKVPKNGRLSSTSDVLQRACRKLNSASEKRVDSAQTELEIRMNNVKKLLYQKLNELTTTCEQLYKDNNKLQRDRRILATEHLKETNVTRTRKRILIERGQIEVQTHLRQDGSDFSSYVEVCPPKQIRSRTNSVTR